MGDAGVHLKGTFSFEEMMENARKNPDFHKVGAIAVFVGVVRGETADGRKVERLELEAYEEKANEILSEICEDLEKREGIIEVQIHHFLGEFQVGEDLVYVLVAGSHREKVFPVLKEAVERYKMEAPIFKKEHVVAEDGAREAYWVSEKQAF